MLEQDAQMGPGFATWSSARRGPNVGLIKELNLQVIGLWPGLGDGIARMVTSAGAVLP